MDPSQDCIRWMSQTDFRTQTKHLRFPGLIQWGHLRQAFQGLFHPWEDLVVLKRTESFGGPERTESFGVGCWLYCVVSAEVPGSSSSPFGFPRYSVC